MGMGTTLDEALREAVREMVIFLRTTGLREADAYALCSLAVDFRIGEAVNNVQMVYGALPKRVFRK
jgi:acetamidase/formamidase